MQLQILFLKMWKILIQWITYGWKKFTQLAISFGTILKSTNNTLGLENELLNMENEFCIYRTLILHKFYQLLT